MKEYKLENVLEFLRHSNFIEEEYGLVAMADAVNAWNYAMNNLRYSESINYITGIHRQLMQRLNPKIAGKIRRCDVFIGGYKAPASKHLNKLLAEWAEKHSSPQTDEECIAAHIAFEKIHPHEDGNGRTGRIIYNIQRLKAGLPIHIIHVEERMEYYKWFKDLI